MLVAGLVSLALWLEIMSSSCKILSVFLVDAFSFSFSFCCEFYCYLICLR